MNINSKQIATIAGCGVAAFMLGSLISSGVKNGTKQTITLAVLLTIPSAIGIHLVVDNRATKRINEAEDKATQATVESAINRDRWQATKHQLDRMTDENKGLLDELEALKRTLQQTENDRLRLADMAKLLPRIEGELVSARELLDEVRAENEAWETTFKERVETESSNRFKLARANEIQSIFDEHDEITSEAMNLFRRLQDWGEKISDSHDSKRHIIRSLATSYNHNLEELSKAIDDEREGYLKQIEILHERVGGLQQKINGDLVEPEYLECGFSQDGKIGNAIAHYLWLHHQIPLKVTGVESSDGIVTTGYAYSRSTPVESITRLIEGESSQIARSLGVYAIEKPGKLSLADILTVKVRRDRPIRKSDKGSLYRSKEDFIKFILSQPIRLRIIGEPGSGKTPTVTVLLSHILKRGFLSGNTPSGQKLPHCIIEACNPLAGISVKNEGNLEQFLRWSSGLKGFKGLAEEYRFRKNPTNSAYTNQVGYIWVADEIDNTMAEITKDESKPFKDALKDGGHVNIGVIVMGQSAMVSTSKGLSIDDQKMMTNLYIDPVSIRTFLTQYGERFYSKKAVEKALGTLEELELEIDEQNERICDTAREFRIGMVTANRCPIFYQLPYFDSTEIDETEYSKTLDAVAEIRASSQQHGATVDNLQVLTSKDSADCDVSAVATPMAVLCPKCVGSTKRNGKTHSGTQKYLCKNAGCKHGFTI